MRLNTFKRYAVAKHHSGVLKNSGLADKEKRTI